jgi:hypothetical protein
MSGQAAPASSFAPTVVVERPAPGLGRGRLEAPFWLVVLLGVLSLTITAVFYVRRLRRRKS